MERTSGNFAAAKVGFFLVKVMMVVMVVVMVMVEKCGAKAKPEH